MSGISTRVYIPFFISLDVDFLQSYKLRPGEKCFTQQILGFDSEA
jgi:hypothetical protein